MCEVKWGEETIIFMGIGFEIQKMFNLIGFRFGWVFDLKNINNCCCKF